MISTVSIACCISVREAAIVNDASQGQVLALVLLLDDGERVDKGQSSVQQIRAFW